MPDNIIKIAETWLDIFLQASAFVLIGIMIAIGQMLQSSENITWRLALGRCITTGGLALVAGSSLTLFPDLPFIAQLSIAAGLASLGNSGLEIIVQKILNKGS